MGLNFSATVGVPQDQTVAQFTDPDGTTVKDFTAEISWGDGAGLDSGRITEPGGPGTPFYVDQTHTYNEAGVYTLVVIISGDDGSYVVLNCKATVTRGGGGAGGPGQPSTPTVDAILLATSLPQGTVSVQTGAGQSGTPAIMPTTSTGAKVMLSQSSPTAQAASLAHSSTDWELLQLLGRNPVADPSTWAVNELILALYGMSF
jgi:hypothetical protein